MADMMAPNSPDDSSDPSSSSDGGSSVDFVIEIACMSDGTYQVSVESGDEEQEEEGSDQGPDQGADSTDDESGESDQTKTAPTFDAALKIAKQLHMEQSGQSSGDDNAPMSQDDAKSYWNQLSAEKSKQATPSY